MTWWYLLYQTAGESYFMKYCYNCGQPMETKPTGRFNEDTGKPEYEWKCVNTKCHIGCSNTGGHDFHKNHKNTFWDNLFGSDTNQWCSKCGSEDITMGL